MSDQAPIEVTFRLTQRDLYAVYVHTLLRMWLLIPIVLCMIAILALSALSDFSAHTSYLAPTLRILTVAMALVGLGFALPYFLARNTMRTSPLFRSELRCVFSESGVEMATAASQSRVDWSGFHRAVELKDFVLLYMSSRVFYIIPKRALASVEQMEALRSLVRGKLGEKARLRSG